jgi:hypothetical protein
MIRCCRLGAWTGLLALAGALVVGRTSPAVAQGTQGFDDPNNYKNGQPLQELMSGAGFAAFKATRGGVGVQFAPELDPGPAGPNPSAGDGGGDFDGGQGRRNVFVNDPCLDPPPEAPFPFNFFNTVQSETEIAVLNKVGGGDDDDDDDDDGDGRGSGRLMVAGYNDSRGFDDNRQGISGFSYSTDGGKLWIDASGLPPRVPSGAPVGTPGSDSYFGDPVVVVHHRTKKFYYSSIYQNAAGGFTLSVNRGEFRVAPRQVPVESRANTRCEGNPAAHGVPDPPALVRERIIWDPPVEAVPPVIGGDGMPGTDDDDFLDKEWLYVDQNTGVLYLTYTRFTPQGETPIELVRSFDQGQTWTPPSVIVPNLLDTFNQATMPITTTTGRVIVTWHARTFSLVTGDETEQRIETANSDNCQTPAPCTFGPPVIVEEVNPQGEPLGYNRRRFTILNAPYINVDKGRDDGVFTRGERRKRGFGNVYITYFDGRTQLPQPLPPICPPPPNPQPPGCIPSTQSPGNPFARAADILLSTSTNNGTTYNQPPAKVSDDPGNTTHVFPSVQINKQGKVFLTWIDRRKDQQNNILNDTWGEVSESRRAGRGRDVRITDVSTDWFTREDAAPDYGDYNSSEVINFVRFVSIWADGRFPPGTFVDRGNVRRRATPDALFAIFRGGGGGDNDD